MKKACSLLMLLFLFVFCIKTKAQDGTLTISDPTYKQMNTKNGTYATLDSTLKSVKVLKFKNKHRLFSGKKRLVITEISDIKIINNQQPTSSTVVVFPNNTIVANVIIDSSNKKSTVLGTNGCSVGYHWDGKNCVADALSFERRFYYLDPNGMKIGGFKSAEEAKMDMKNRHLPVSNFDKIYQEK